MLDCKLRRAATLVAKIAQLDKEYGSTVPARGDDRTRLARFVSSDPRWSAILTKGQRIVFGPVYGTFEHEGTKVFGERRVADPDWTTIELRDYRRSLMVVNLGPDDEINLFRYIPGAWEEWFGIDNKGDTTPHEALYVPRPNSPELLALLESPDASLPPMRRGPLREEDDRRRFFNKPRRSRTLKGWRG